LVKKISKKRSREPTQYRDNALETSGLVLNMSGSVQQIIKKSPSAAEIERELLHAEQAG
jgi:hypothetical protein